MTTTEFNFPEYVDVHTGDDSYRLLYLSSPPPHPIEGLMYVNSKHMRIEAYIQGSWVPLTGTALIARRARNPQGMPIGYKRPLPKIKKPGQSTTLTFEKEDKKPPKKKRKRELMLP